MAASTCPESSGTLTYSPLALQELLTQIHGDAERTWLALSGLLELLHGCDPDHQISPAKLVHLLEPTAAAVEMLCGDVGTAKHAFFVN